MPSIEDWTALLADEPDNELVRFSLAKSLFEARRFGDALGHFDQLVNGQGDFALAWSYLARCYLEEGDREQARIAAEKGLELALSQKHEVPEMEARAVLEELESEF